MAALDQLTEAFEDAIADPLLLQRRAERAAARLRRSPDPVPFPARRLSEELGLRVWLKREDLLHTGACCSTTPPAPADPEDGQAPG